MYTPVPYRRDVRGKHMPSLFDDRFLRSFFDMGEMVNRAGFRVDVRETPEAYVLDAELPGVKQEQITVTIDNDVLTIAAEVAGRKQEEHTSYLYTERRSGHMSRAFSVEGVDQDGVTADYRDGVLTVRLPKARPEPEKAVRTIAIGSGE